MDLLATVRKEGSRGGRGDFKWSDVQASTHRENYLGHSLMAPVGRWQKGRDLNWYAKGDSEPGDGEDPEEKAARQRREEIKRVKEAEEDALARALGLPVPERNNPNMQALGDRRAVEKIVKDTAGEEGASSSKGIGYGARAAASGEYSTERIEGTAEQQDKELDFALKEYKRRHGEKRRRSRSRSRSPRREKRRHRRHESRDRDRDRDHFNRHRSRSRSRQRHRRKRSRSQSEDHDRHSHARRSDRNRSPQRRYGDGARESKLSGRGSSNYR